MACIECYSSIVRFKQNKSKIHSKQHVESLNIMNLIDYLNKGKQQTEEFELKCYKLSENCLLVDTDKRCPISSYVCQSNLKTKPLLTLSDGRQYLDDSQCKLNNSSKVKVVYDNPSAKVIFDTSELTYNHHHNDKKKLMMRKENDCQFLLQNDDNEAYEDSINDSIDSNSINSNSSLENNVENIEQLKNRSFVLIERQEGQRIIDNEQQRQQQQQQRQQQLKSVREIDQEEYSNDFKEEFILSLEKQVSRVRERQSSGIKVEERNNNNSTKVATKFINWTNKLTNKLLQNNNNNNNNNKTETMSPIISPNNERPQEQQNLHWTKTLNNCSSNNNDIIAMISYNHIEAKQYAIQLHSELNKLGIRAYLDLYDISSGLDWQDSLNCAILNSLVFIPLITPSYGETLWTRREFKLADILEKRIIPINFLSEKFNWPPKSLAIQFATLQYLDWKKSPIDSNDFNSCWPNECVKSIAFEIKKCIISVISKASQQQQQQLLIERGNDCGPLRIRQANNQFLKIRKLQSIASPNSDSGYDTERDPIISTSTSTTSSPNCSLQQNDYKKALTYYNYGSTDNLNCCDTKNVAVDVVDDKEKVEGNVAIEQEETTVKQKKKKKIRRKSFFGKRAIRVFSMVKRSIGMEIDGDSDGDDDRRRQNDEWQQQNNVVKQSNGETKT